MKTVNEIAKITGISRRAIRYYDEIGLLKPTEISESGYRLYDDEALGILQQILFFKEVGMPLKDIKLILDNPNIDRIKLLENHKNLLILKRDCISNLISLVDKIIKEPNTMNFTEFKIIKEIEKTIDENLKLIKNARGEDYLLNDPLHPGNKSLIASVSNYMDYILSNTELIKDMYGSLENYLENLKQCPERLEGLDCYIEDMKEIYKQIGELRDQDISCPKVQELVAKIDNYNKQMNGIGMKEIANIDVDSQKLSDEMIKESQEYMQSFIKAHDELYGEGSYEFLTRAINYYMENLEK